ncbi:MAG TPA: hypothetical protein VM098_02710 [Phycisphaerae bacterium]|nr:hypothetical protein [Phycisphaerae bacterium]
MSSRARYAVLALLVAAAAAAILAATLPRHAATARGPAAASQPTTQPRQSPEDLAAACKQAADGLRGRLDRSFNFVVSPPFVVAGNCSPRQLDEYLKWSVVRPAEAMWKSYFDKKPVAVITILLFGDGDSYRRWAKELFGDTNVAHFGYCRRDGVMVMDISTGTGTLVHELTHALIKYDFPDVPDWFNEGLGSLHEQCNVGERSITGLVNWRLAGLQQAIDKGELRSLKQLVTADDFYGRLRGLNYAHARYFVMYMQHRGVLEKFYKTLRDGYAERGEIPARRGGVGRRNAAPPSSNRQSSTRAAQRSAASQSSITNRQSMAVSAVETSLGLPIDEIDKSMRKWVMTLKFR